MSETLYNLVKRSIDILSWEDFQVLCFLYLRDRGYNATLGPIPGCDFKHDIYGSGSNGNFVAFCTTQETGLKKKFRKETIATVKYYTALLQPLQEILFLPRDKAFSSPVEEVDFKAKLLLQISEIEPRYQNQAPVLRFTVGYNLAREICSIGEQGESYKFLKKKMLISTTQLSEDEESSNDEPSHPILSEDDFLKRLSNYPNNLPIEFQQEPFQDIVAVAWNTIVYNPFFAGKLLRSETLSQSKIRHLIMPLCKIGCYNPINSTELQDFLYSMEDKDYFFQDGHPIREHTLLIIRMLRLLFYHQPDILRDREIRQWLEHLVDKREVFWDEFFVDLYFRYSCDYLAIDDELLSTVQMACDRYLQEQANKPLSRLWPLIIAPCEASTKYQKEAVIELIWAVARDCRDVIECKWCVSTLLRIMPLYTCSEEELDHSNLVSSLINEFDRALASRSPHLQFMYLKDLLRAFTRTRDLKFLSTYEQGFIRLHTQLLPPQISHLQLEYVSCLYACCQFLDNEAISQLHFGNMVFNNKNLLDDVLFQNRILPHNSNLLIKLSLSDRGSLFKWLRIYIRALYRLYAKRYIKENHIRALQFRATSGIYEIRSELCDSVLSSLQDYIDSPLNYRLSFYARSTATFALVPRQKHIELIMKYIAKGLQADQYSIIRNARPIAQGLYSCYYYGNCENHKEIEHSADRLANVTEIGNSMPKLHWAWYAGIKYEARDIEREFLNELWSQAGKIPRIYQLFLKKGEDVPVIFHDTTLELIKLYSSMESLFAMVLSTDELRDPEAWNIMGTTVYNNRHDNDNDIESLEQAANFYAIARCFSRTRKTDDQKYCYNYIYCKALAYKMINSPPGESYVEQTARYLRSKESEFFAYKEERTRPYFDLLGTWWDTIPDNIRRFIKEELSRVYWIRDGNFVNTIPIKQKE